VKPRTIFLIAGLLAASIKLLAQSTPTAPTNLTLSIDGTPVSNPPTGTIVADSLLDFETASNGTVVTSSVLTSATKGKLFNGWVTVSAPNAQTQGATPNLTIATSASSPYSFASTIDGISYPGTGGTRGLHAVMGNDGAAELTFSPGYLSISLGFYFRFNGAQINSSPRDLVALVDSGGGFQYLQLNDASPSIHAHWQPPYTMVGNDVTIQRGKWYWISMHHVPAGQNTQINIYDPANGYSLVGTTGGAVTTPTGAATVLQFGIIKYSSGASQSVDYDNFVIDTTGKFPLLPQ
jgi:hypothetical protein